MLKRPNLTKLSICSLTFVFVANFVFCYEKKEEDPIEILKGKWSAFDFKYSDDWDVSHFGFFVLRTPQFLKEYYALLKQWQEISDEDIAQDMALAEEFLIIEASMEALNKDHLIVDKWKFELKDKNRNKYKPIKVESSSIAKRR